MSDPEDPAFGVRGFSIAGRMMLQRERLKGMSDTERQWRAQWVKDQELAPTEPRDVPEFYKATNNIFRRLYKTPLGAFQRMLEPVMGKSNAFYVRHTITKTLILVCTSWICYYMYKYNSNDWTRIKSLEVHVTRPVMYPDDPNYPNYAKFDDYYDQGFSSSVFAKPEKKK